jgi:hypothetical protein
MDGMVCFGSTAIYTSTPGLNGTGYQYDLVGPQDGAQAFLPRKDAHLLEAYYHTSGLPGDPVVDALLAEIQRRGLKC